MSASLRRTSNQKDAADESGTTFGRSVDGNQRADGHAVDQIHANSVCSLVSGTDPGGVRFGAPRARDSRRRPELPIPRLTKLFTAVIACQQNRLEFV